jgi:hypothetical protein
MVLFLFILLLKHVKMMIFHSYCRWFKPYKILQIISNNGINGINHLSTGAGFLPSAVHPGSPPGVLSPPGDAMLAAPGPTTHRP